MRAIILSVGDELVLGQTVDTNSSWMSQQLAAVGCAVAAHLTVADDQRAIETALEESVGRCDAVIVSGGIGPTDDDLTRQALAAVLRVELVESPLWIERLEAFFRKVNRPMSPLNRVQAMLPRGARLIDNTAGTAAGIDADYVSPDQKTVCRIFVMPGVPKEMKVMFARDVLPHVAAQAGGAAIRSRTLHTFGLGESAVADKLGDLMRRDRNPSVGTTVTGGIVSLRVNARFPSAEEAASQLEQTEAACRAVLRDLIFGRDEETLAQAVAELLKEHPTARRWAPAVCTAESCTGGLVAKYLTDIPGSSSYFRQGWVTYHNEAKVDQLGVLQTTLDEYGAVSEQTVREMARAAATRSGAPYALAVSGVAGPGGGTAAKPVGTVCIALAYPDEDSPLKSDTTVRTFTFPGDREMIRDRSAKMALTLLRFNLLGKPLPF